MRKKLFYTIIIVGAISNAIILSNMDTPLVLIVGMTVLYIAIFMGAIYLIEPRLVKMEREQNVRAYPFLRELMDAKKATVTLRDGTVYYNTTFGGYEQNRDATTIILQVHTVKTKKEPLKITEHAVKLVNIQSVKKVQ